MTSLLPHPLESHSRAQPHHLALCDGMAESHRRVDYRTLAGRSGAVAAWAQGLGLQPGDRVALLGSPGLDLVTALHGLGWLGAVAVPLPAEGPAAALTARLQRAQAKACVVLPGPGPLLDDPAAWAADTPWHQLPAHVLTAAAPQHVPPAAPWRLDAPLVVLETSGTSGTPSVVPLTVQQVLMQSLGSAARLGHLPGDIWLDVLPLHHIGGLMILWRALIFGASVCLPGKFEAATMAPLLQHGAITLTSVVPTMLARLLPLLRATPCHANLRAVLLGGAPTPQALFDEATAIGVPVALTWGMTEAASGVCVRRPEKGGAPPDGARPSSRNAGPPLPFTQVWADSDGTLQVAGPTVAGALRTGDRGTLEDDGSVTILGRRDRVIISGGENIAPEEVEAVLLSHSAVADAAVVGEPDATWGERPVAHVVARTAISDQELVAFCRARLATFQIPTRFVWHAELPRNAMGKLQRVTLATGAAEDSR